MYGFIDWSNPISDHPLNAGLVSRWMAGPDNPYWGGPKFLDLVPMSNGRGGNHGTLTNGPAWRGALGRPGGRGCLEHDGTDDHETIASSLVSGFPLTISAWVRSTANTAPYNVFTISRSDNTEDYFLLRIRGDVAGDPIEARQNGGGVEDAAISVTGVTVNEWIHLTARFSASDNRSIFLNGVLSATNTTSIGFPPAMDQSTIGALRRSIGTIQFFPGQIDDVRVWSRALSDDEILMMYLDSLLGSPETLNWVGGEAGYTANDRLHRTSALTGLAGTGQQCFNPSLTGV